MSVKQKMLVPSGASRATRPAERVSARLRNAAVRTGRVLRAIWPLKLRFLRHGCVAKLRDTFGYRRGSRLALTQNSSVLFAPANVQRYTS